MSPYLRRMTDGPDLDAYFARIGWDGPRDPTLETLQGIVLAHAKTIPFENLNPFLGLPVRLDLETLQAKLVHGGRGGYCFEQNGLLLAVLRAMGFEVTGLIGRVIWNQPIETITARSHMIIRVALGDADRIVDIGFGGGTLTGVLALTPGVEQATPHEPFRLVDEGGGSLREEVLIRDAWRATYRFDLTPQNAIDYEVSNHFTSTHPNSHFLHTLIAARVDDGRRHTLRGLDLTTHHLGGDSEHRALASPAEVETVLEEVFGIALPERDRLREKLERLF